MHRFDEVFRASFARVMGEGAYNPQFTSRFYELFLASSPLIARLFADTNMSRQKTMLHDSLGTLVDFSAHRTITPQMRHLAAIHGPGAHDVPPESYELWLDSLLQTVAEMDPQYSPDVALAWRLSLAPGISYLQWAFAHGEANSRDGES